MLQTLLAILALIASLAASGVAWILYRATLAARSGTPGEVMVRMAELEQEWASTLDSNARFLKRIAKREQDAAKRASSADAPPEIPNLNGKAALRAVAREKGLMR